MVPTLYRKRANSAPSVVNLSTRDQGHLYYKMVINYPKGIELLNGVENIQRSAIANEFVLNEPSDRVLCTTRSQGTGSTKPPTKGPTSRVQQRRGTLSRALSITQEQKEKIRLKYISSFISS